MKQWFEMTIVTAFISVMTLAFSASGAVVAYWDFSSDSNGVTDVSGNCHSLTNSGVVISNGVAVFNGSQTNFSTVSKLDLTGNNNLTVEFFMRSTSTNKGMLIEQTNPYWQNTGAFMVDVNETGTGTVMGGFCTLAAGTKLNLDISPTNSASDGFWHHVAIVFDKAKTGADRSMLYVDRIAQGTYLTYTNDTNSTVFCNSTLFIGSRGNSDMKFRGELDDVRVSNTALTTNQFLQARSTGTPPVVAYWRFDDGAGLTDSSGNGNTLAGSGVVFTGGVARFSGTHTFNTASALNLTAYTNLTVEFFMRSSAATSSAMILVEQTNPFFSNPGAFIATLNEGSVAGQMMGGFCTATGTKLNLDMTAANAGADGQWHHVAIVYDKTKTGTDRSMYYLDGVAQGVYLTWTDGSDAAFRNATLYVGSRGNGSMKYIGEMDDLRITGAALQPGQFLKAPSTEIPRVVAYWPFSHQQPLADATGNGHALSNTGVTFADDAAVFDGTHTAFSTKPWTLNLRPYSALTIEYFVRTTATNVMEALEHSANFTALRGGFVAVFNEANRGQIESGFSMPGTASYNIDSTPSNAILDGAWHHVALVYDPTQSGEDRVRFYLDHIQQGKRTATWNSDADTFFLNDTLYIGSRANSSSKFGGALDDIKITGAVLTPAEFMEKRTYTGGTILRMW
jgi:hypothetical protein